MKASAAFLGLLTLTSLAFAADPPAPKFRAQTIDDKIQIGYGVTCADVDGDGKSDILLADKKQFVWYRNPTWEKFVIAENLTQRDNVCLAAQDLDGDGKCGLAVGADWDPNDREHSGAVFYMIPPADRTQKWEAVSLPAEPTVHRMRWIDLGQRKWGLLVVPLHGRGKDPNAAPRVLLYYPPPDVRDAWKTEQLLTGEMHATHNFDVALTHTILLAAKEGVQVVFAGKTDVVMPHLSEHPTGEVRGTTGPIRFATVEPMHGNELVAYVQVNQKINRRLLSDKLVEGHALACADFIRAGSDQILAGWRGGGGGVRLFTPTDAKFTQWRESVIDDGGMACEDFCLADLNGDGKLDIVASGRSTHNVKIYFNETPAPLAAPATQPRVLWQERHAIRGLGGRMSLMSIPGTGYRVVGSAAFREDEKNEKSFKELWWMLSTDSSGRRRELTEFSAKGNQADIAAAMRLPDNRMLVIGGMLEWIAQLDASGALVKPPDRIRREDCDTSICTAIADRPDSLLIAGSMTHPTDERPEDAWLARVGHDGTILWQKDFDRGHDETAYSILHMPDGGCVISIVSGKYNKFGQGPSVLWLVRCDRDGKAVAEAVIPEGRIYPGGQKYLAPCGDGFVVSYTTSQLPPINRVPLNRGPAFDVRLACFDGQMKRLWQKQLPDSSTLGTAVLLALPDGTIAVIGEHAQSPCVTIVDPRGEVVSQTSVALRGNYNVADAIFDNEGVVVVGSYAERGPPRGNPADDDVLIFKIR